jgi:hypothetical protein
VPKKPTDWQQKLKAINEKYKENDKQQRQLKNIVKKAIGKVKQAVVGPDYPHLYQEEDSQEEQPIGIINDNSDVGYYTIKKRTSKVDLLSGYYNSSRHRFSTRKDMEGYSPSRPRQMTTKKKSENSYTMKSHDHSKRSLFGMGRNEVQDISMILNNQTRYEAGNGREAKSP